MVQDGLSALQYVLLPVLAQALGLNYTQVGVLRSINTFAMSVLEVPAGMLAERVGERRLLLAGLAGAGAGYAGVALAEQFWWIAAGFAMAGAGAAFQHSLSSALLVRHFEGRDRRRALGTYNAAGDAGKLLFTAAFTTLAGAGVAWSNTLLLLIVPAVLLAGFILATPQPDPNRGHPAGESQRDVSGWGIIHPGKFSLLNLLIYLDSTLQAVFLTFLAFVLIERGSSEVLAALGVTIALTGGMTGKFVCGHLAARYGDRLVFALMQVITAVGLMALIALPLGAVFWLLPAIGLVVQGSSTMTYGAVADFLHPRRQSRGYSLVYSLSGFAGVSGPLLFGAIADVRGLSTAVVAMVVLALITVPMSYVLRGAIHEPAAPAGKS